MGRVAGLPRSHKCALPAAQAAADRTHHRALGKLDSLPRTPPRLNNFRFRHLRKATQPTGLGVTAVGKAREANLTSLPLPVQVSALASTQMVLAGSGGRSRSWPLRPVQDVAAEDQQGAQKRAGHLGRPPRAGMSYGVSYLGYFCPLPVDSTLYSQRGRSKGQI